MPVYDYSCTNCGDFTVFRPIAEYDQSYPGPDSEQFAPRVLLTVSAMAMMDGAMRTAISTNERIAHAPRRARKGHTTNCSCCTGASSGRTFRGKDGSKSFPKARPWTISH